MYFGQVPGAKEFQEPLPPAANKETRKGRKRKNASEEEGVPVESAYSKRQAELAMAVEEDARLEGSLFFVILLIKTTIFLAVFFKKKPKLSLSAFIKN